MMQIRSRHITYGFYTQVPTLKALLAVALIYMFGISVPGAVEGYYYPVVSPMELTRTESTEQNVIEFWGKSEKLRGECYLDHIEWRVGNRNGKSNVANLKVLRSVLLPKGPFEFGPWTVDITPEEMFTGQSYSDMFHRCFYFGIPSPWLTKSPFWN